MSKIQVLDQITIDKIAAGEVIERPASIVKELAENSIDAGAGAVVVEIKEGGISFIRITDNGCGIAKEDVSNAFLRHSTSKIRSVDDLMDIHTLGFRGEALSSIAAVSRVELITKTRENDFGITYRIEGGKELSIEETGAPDGTTFLVRQLFYNTPARRKFLKTPMTEASHVADLVTRLALSHPEISFQFINNGQSKIHTSGNGNLKDVIYHIYGRDIASHLLEVKAENEHLKLTGYIGEPIVSRGNRNFENYYINGRYVKSQMISKAIEDAYKDFTMQHKYPFTVLHLEVKGDLLDVNVHPTKMEVRFGNQQEVYNFLCEAIDRSLHHEELIPHVEAPEPPKAAEVSFASTAPQKSVQSVAKKQSAIYDFKDSNFKKQSTLQEKQSAVGNLSNDFTQKQSALCNNSDKTGKKDMNYFMEQMRERVMTRHQQEEAEKNSPVSQTASETVKQNIIREETVPYQGTPQNTSVRQNTPEQTVAATPVSVPVSAKEAGVKKESEAAGKPKQLNLFDEKLLDKKSVKEHRIIGQLFDTYWLIEFQNSLYIIDQHAAHERVLYEKTLRGMKTRDYTSQNISPPIVLNLSMGEAQLLEKYMDQFTRIGFEFESFGPDSYAVCAVPDNLFSIAKKDLLMEMIDCLSDEIYTGLTPDVVDEKIASMSCKAAVKGNMKLSYAEADALIGELLALDNPYHCPHGRPTIISMSKREIEKKFKRIV